MIQYKTITSEQKFTLNQIKKCLHCGMDFFFPPRQTLLYAQLSNTIMQLNVEVNHAANSNDCKCTWLSWRFSAPGRGDDSSHTARLRTSFPLAPDWIKEREKKTENTIADHKSHQLFPKNYYPHSQQIFNLPLMGILSNKPIWCTGQAEGFFFCLYSFLLHFTCFHHGSQ